MRQRERDTSQSLQAIVRQSGGRAVSEHHGHLELYHVGERGRGSGRDDEVTEVWPTPGDGRRRRSKVSYAGATGVAVGAGQAGRNIWKGRCRHLE